MAEVSTSHDVVKPHRPKLSQLFAASTSIHNAQPTGVIVAPIPASTPTLPEFRPSAPVATSPSVCKYSKLRLKDTLWKDFSEVFYQRMDNKRAFVQLGQITTERRTVLDNLECDWVTIGIVANRSEKRQAKTKHFFEVWHLTSFVAELNLYVYGEPPDVSPGTVIALLNPNIQVSASPLSLQVDGPEVIMVLGESTDWKRCPGKACRNSIDSRKETHCGYHVEEQLREARRRRHAVNVNPVGKRSHHAPNLEKVEELDISLGPITKLPENKFRGRGSRIVAALKTTPAQAALPATDTAKQPEPKTRLIRSSGEASKPKPSKRGLTLPPARPQAPLPEPKKQKLTDTASAVAEFVELEESDASG